MSPFKPNTPYDVESINKPATSPTALALTMPLVMAYTIVKVNIKFGKTPKNFMYFPKPVCITTKRIRVI